MHAGSDKVGAVAVNQGLVLDEALLVAEGSDWRGALAQLRSSGMYRMASAIIQQAQSMTREVQIERDAPDREWMRSGVALRRY